MNPSHQELPLQRLRLETRTRSAFLRRRRARRRERHSLCLCHALQHGALSYSNGADPGLSRMTAVATQKGTTAVLADVGTPKVRSIERAIKQIARWVDVDARIDIWRKEQGGDLLEGADWVIGA